MREEKKSGAPGIELRLLLLYMKSVVRDVFLRSHHKIASGELLEDVRDGQYLRRHRLLKDIR